MLGRVASRDSNGDLEILIGKPSVGGIWPRVSRDARVEMCDAFGDGLRQARSRAENRQMNAVIAASAVRSDRYWSKSHAVCSPRRQPAA